MNAESEIRKGEVVIVDVREAEEMMGSSDNSVLFNFEDKKRFHHEAHPDAGINCGHEERYLMC